MGLPPQLNILIKCACLKSSQCSDPADQTQATSADQYSTQATNSSLSLSNSNYCEAILYRTLRTNSHVELPSSSKLTKSFNLLIQETISALTSILCMVLPFSSLTFLTRSEEDASVPVHCAVLGTDVPGLQGTPLVEMRVTVHNCGSHPVYIVHLFHCMLGYCR